MTATLTSSAGDSLVMKTNTTLSVNIEGGTVEDYTFKFIVHNEQTGAWYKIRDFEAGNTCEWYTGPVGLKTLYADIKDQNDNVVRVGLMVSVHEPPQKLADINSLREFLANVEDRLDLKAATGHQHTAFNGVTVLLSDTAPTDNDPDVITLLVDTSALPTITEVTTEVVEKWFSMNFLYVESIPQLRLTAHVLVNGTEVTDAQFWFGYGRTNYQNVYSEEVRRDWSSENTFTTLTTVNLIKVRVAGVQKSFSFTSAATTGQQYEPVGDSGSTVNGTWQIPISHDTTGLSVRYYFGSGVTAASFKSIEFFEIGEYPSTARTTVEDLLNNCTLTETSFGVVTTGSEFFEAPVTKTFTQDDAGTTWTYIVKAIDINDMEHYLFGWFNIQEDTN